MQFLYRMFTFRNCRYFGDKYPVKIQDLFFCSKTPIFLKGFLLLLSYTSKSDDKQITLNFSFVHYLFLKKQHFLSMLLLELF